MRGSSDDEGSAKHVEAIYIDKWLGSLCVRAGVNILVYDYDWSGEPIAWRHALYRYPRQRGMSRRTSLRHCFIGLYESGSTLEWSRLKKNIVRRRRLEFFFWYQFFAFLRNLFLTKKNIWFFRFINISDLPLKRLKIHTSVLIFIWLQDIIFFYDIILGDSTLSKSKSSI